MSDLYDVVIIGGGPAGLTAAIYLTRAKYRVLLLEKEKFGGQITISYEVVNYPGVSVCSGKELTDVMYKQAEYFGTEFVLAKATNLELDKDVKIVHTDKGYFKCLGVLLATGARPRTIGFKGENEFKGRGVAYCATCDGEFFTGKEVFVIGGGFAAAEESVFLTKYASHITILIREEDFTCAKAVADEARNHEKISVITDTIVEEVSGDGVVNYIRYKNHKTGKMTEYQVNKKDSIGVFVFAGYEPETELVKDVAKLDDYGYIITDKEQKSSVEGLYAAGDICIKPSRQVVTATGDGALAATELEKFVSAARKKTNLYPKEPKIKRNDLKVVENKKDDSYVLDGQNEIFNPEMISRLKTIFSKMEKSIVLKLYTDERKVSDELENYINSLAQMTDKIIVKYENKILDDKENKGVFIEEERQNDTDIKEGRQNDVIKKENTKSLLKKNMGIPCVKVFDEDDNYTGLAFHGVPGGHEFSSFVLGLYNVAGPGQRIDEEIKKRIQNIDYKLDENKKQKLDNKNADKTSKINGNDRLDIKILVSLSCTMCPELVVAVQQMATYGKNITAEVYDIKYFENLKNKYNVMSVPCIIINDEQIFFGKKSLEEIVDIVERSIKR